MNINFGDLKSAALMNAMSFVEANVGCAGKLGNIWFLEKTNSSHPEAAKVSRDGWE